MENKLDRKMKRSAPKRKDRSIEYAYMQKHSNDSAKVRLKDVPYQLRYQREHGTQRAEQ